MIVNGIEFEGWKCCKQCGSVSLNYRYCEGNKSIQVRCNDCGKFLGNVRYDTKTKGMSKEERRKYYAKEYYRKLEAKND